MNKRLREIETRMTEIRNLLQGDGEVDLDAINAELDSLTQERKNLQERRKNIMNRLGGEVVDRAGDNEHGEEETRATAASPEYRDAWAAMMMGRELNDAQVRFMRDVNPELREAFTHTTINTSVLVPETVVGGIWKRAEEMYPLWGDVRKFSVQGKLTSKRHTGITQGDAAWYDEPTPVEDEANTFAEFSLDGCELAKSVTVSWKLRVMAVPEFISFITREIGERMGVALGNAVYSGKGKPGSGDTFKPEPRGIKTALLAETSTPQAVTYTSGSMTEANLRTAIAKLHSSYVGGAVFYANNTTVWTVLAGIQDTTKRPIFLNDVAVQGAVGRIFGKPVKVDASLADGEVLVGDPKMYWANVAAPMTMHTEEHVKARETDYMGYAIVDGDVYDTKAFALLRTATSGSSD